MIDSLCLTSKARKIIANPHSLVYVSAATSWEITIEKSLGKLKAPDNIDRIVEEKGLLKLPICLCHGDALSKFPLFHRDPFDRMLIAQALVEDLVIITADRKFQKYDVRLLEV